MPWAFPCPHFTNCLTGADFPRIKVGRRVLVPVEALRAWLAREAERHD